MSRAAVDVAGEKPLTLEKWAELDEDVEGELVGGLDPRLRSLEVFELTDGGRYVLALSAGEGRVRIPGCQGLVLDLDGLWKEIDETARREGRSRRRGK